jgi:hypothetical protein
VCAAIAAVVNTTAAPPDPPRPPPAGAPDSWGQPPSLGGSNVPGPLGESRDMLLRGKMQRIGRFDPDGNFIPDAAVTRMNASLFGQFGAVSVNGTGGSLVYEHRSGRLIRGIIAREPRGVFVPEVGSTVIDLKKDFDLNKPDRLVYNLRAETLGKVPVTSGPDPPKASQPAGWKLVPFREAFPKSPEIQNPWFARVIGEVMELGHLSDEGEFVPDYGLPVFPYVKVKQPDVLQDSSGRTIYYTLPKDGKDSEEVYEYRSGRLIRGALQKTGNFVPELGSKVLDFKEYDPMTDRRRIYNLPGVLRKAQ